MAWHHKVNSYNGSGKIELPSNRIVRTGDVIRLTVVSGNQQSIDHLLGNGFRISPPNMIIIDDDDIAKVGEEVNIFNNSRSEVGIAIEDQDPTYFEDIHPLVRAIMGDTDPDCLLYTAAALNAQIDLQITLDRSGVYVEATPADSERIFTKALTKLEKSILALKVCRNLSAAMPDSMMYKNPVTTYARSGHGSRFWAYINDQLDSAMNGNGSVIGAGIMTNEIEMFVTYPYRFVNDFEKALLKI